MARASFPKAFKNHHTERHIIRIPVCFPFMPLLQAIPFMSLVLCCLDVLRNSLSGPVPLKIPTLNTRTIGPFTLLKNAKGKYRKISLVFSLLFPEGGKKSLGENKYNKFLIILSGFSFPKSV